MNIQTAVKAFKKLKPTFDMRYKRVLSFYEVAKKYNFKKDYHNQFFIDALEHYYEDSIA